MIYSHFVFALLRITLLLLGGRTITETFSLERFLSIIISCDVIATIAIYFIPKFMSCSSPRDRFVHRILSVFVSEAPDMMSRAGAGSNVDENKDGFSMDEEDEMAEVSSHRGRRFVRLVDKNYHIRLIYWNQMGQLRVQREKTKVFK